MEVLVCHNFKSYPPRCMTSLYDLLGIQTIFIITPMSHSYREEHSQGKYSSMRLTEWKWPIIYTLTQKNGIFFIPAIKSCCPLEVGLIADHQAKTRHSIFCISWGHILKWLLAEWRQPSCDLWSKNSLLTNMLLSQLVREWYDKHTRAFVWSLNMQLREKCIFFLLSFPGRRLMEARRRRIVV